MSDGNSTKTSTETPGGVRLGQKLLRVNFRDGEPYFEYGTVSRITKTTFDVTYADGVSKSLTTIGRHGSGWFKKNWLAAIDYELEICFRAKHHQIIGRGLLSDWPVEELVALVNRLWRFRKKCLKKLNRE